MVLASPGLGDGDSMGVTIPARASRLLRTEPGGPVHWILKRICRARFKVLRALKAPVVTTEYGVRMAGNWRDGTFKMCVVGSYGTALSDLVTQYATPFSFLDIGANQGLYSLLAQTNPKCVRVLAFEPVAETVAFLERNLALNGADKVQVCPLAIAAEDGPVEIRKTRNHSGGATLRDGEGSNGGVEVIQCLSHRGLNGMIPADGSYVVKIDVEGLEEVVLEEIRQCDFFPFVTHLFCEIDRRWIDAQAMTERLRSLGFTEFRQIGVDPEHYDLLASR
jgi:FkbM family methyltransferase